MSRKILEYEPVSLLIVSNNRKYYFYKGIGINILAFDLKNITFDIINFL